MPTGNHHYTPHGYWFQTPSSSTIPRLVLTTARNLSLFGLSILAINAWRSLHYNYTYTRFIGKTMTMGNVSTATHEPASVEEIDRMKAEEAKRKKQRQGR